ncbi:YybH family protein [Amycolatopsis nigrescens]|uniref:YybH family protein n=1 Tax=Amycolatopsis nigrescens TaxID=381445 RepID=UPI0003634F01|nr:nuclear transport factor 2 family protein [Amycolatopsis nigrescens]
MTTTREQAAEPEDLTRLFVERVNAGDVEGMVALYEPDAMIAFPPGARTIGHDAMREVFTQLVARPGRIEPQPLLPTVRNGDLAITSTRPPDNTAGWVQVVRRQPDGSWLRVLDTPEAPFGPAQP